jgi:hypothetical protein
MRMARWLWQQATKSPARQAFSLGGCSLILSASQFAALPGSDRILMWFRILSGSVLMLAVVFQVRAGLMLRRRHRTELLRAVATAVSALERRRRDERGQEATAEE